MSSTTAKSVNRHSATAEGVAYTRAVHQLIDAPPLIFADPLALAIIGPDGEARMRANLPMHAIEGMLRARASVAVRSRFAEEELEQAMAVGTRQYVILGAGLDTFAYRRADLATKLAVFEVDQPDTQCWKRERLETAGIVIPANVRFVPVDFNESTLADRLAAAGFRRDLPALFSWLGVVYYLSRPAVADTLRFIAGQPAASCVVFDYALPESCIQAQHRELLREFLEFNRNRSERWQTFFAPDEMQSLLKDCGFGEIVRLDYATITGRYLAGRTDALAPSPLIELISARNR
jgi:methyltransferase (TIGR00027 family)